MKHLVVILGFIYSCSALSLIRNDEETRIVGGKEVDIRAAPFIVLLMTQGSPLCGASIISPYFVITAAHCTDSMTPKKLSIRSGANKAGEGDKYNIAKIIDHPSYDSSSFSYDFSLLKIFGRFHYNERQLPVKLPEENDESKVGQAVRVLGWGNTMSAYESTDYLREVELIIIDHEECEKSYNAFKIDVKLNKVCAVHPERVDGKDACQGDSGGPLQRIDDGVLIGVVSFGLGCARAKYPGIYSRVSSVRSWIRDVAHV